MAARHWPTQPVTHQVRPPREALEASRLVSAVEAPLADLWLGADIGPQREVAQGPRHGQAAHSVLVLRRSQEELLGWQTALESRPLATGQARAAPRDGVVASRMMDMPRMPLNERHCGQPTRQRALRAESWSARNAAPADKPRLIDAAGVVAMCLSIAQAK